VSGVYETLLKIANSHGQGVAKTKQALVERLLLAARGEECRFLVRTLCQNLRVGAVRASLLTALARAVALTPPNMQPKAPDLVTTPPDLVAPSAQQDVFTNVPLMAERVRPLLAAGKKDKAPDEARLELTAALAEAEALVKGVFVQRPDYGALVAALLDGGLHSLAERVPLTVGMLVSGLLLRM
jgi:DNA ligase-1